MHKKHVLGFLPLLLLVLFFAACGSQPTLTTKVSDSKATGQQTGDIKLHSGGGCFYRNGDLVNHADLGQTSDPPRWQVGNSPFFGAKFSSCRDLITLNGSGTYDFYQVRWSRPGLAEQQYSTIQSVSGFTNAHFQTIYSFSMQGCTSHWYGSSCTDWSPKVAVATYYPGDCHVGYVWREAAVQDFVCVSPSTRSLAAYDNGQSAWRVNPLGAYGPTTCVQGYVWREAFYNDHVCVLPQTRSQAAYDNAHASANTYH